ncbi:hypothetical protein FISHEDRAFT_74658 [Fistulina hepatica ATCC 64428]|uniref:Uncharacterized protein n=1 Tax=Fistulina hepatica ATCC 64428 TaxID=1128425 RepID=A0A0D7A988_9AGAR|nr:hypothetical protein FISHEDRAFT_74658 [Fistulina hepatica ATCC 64428]
MTEPASTLGTFSLQAFSDFAFLLPPNLYVLAPSRLNAYNTPLPSLVDRPFRATNDAWKAPPTPPHSTPTAAASVAYAAILYKPPEREEAD